MESPRFGIRSLYATLGADKIEELCKNFYDSLYADDSPEHKFFVDQFKSTPKDLAIHNLHTFLVQKCGGPEYFGGMVKESSFIREMHVELFAVRQQDVDTWLALFEGAMEKTGLDVEVKTLMRNWATGQAQSNCCLIGHLNIWFLQRFGKTIVNNGCPRGRK
jgi:truncated hemoglobin YjbI